MNNKTIIRIFIILIFVQIFMNMLPWIVPKNINFEIAIISFIVIFIIYIIWPFFFKKVWLIIESKYKYLLLFLIPIIYFYLFLGIFLAIIGPAP